MALDQHRCEIVDDFLSHDLHAECACGWVGGKVDDNRAARRSFGEHVATVEGLTLERLPEAHDG